MFGLKSPTLLRARLGEIGAYWRRTAPQRRLPAGAKAGLSLVAMACLSIGTLSYQAFGPREVIAHEALPSVPSSA